jgi:hypothetical protein
MRSSGGLSRNYEGTTGSGSIPPSVIRRMDPRIHDALDAEVQPLIDA